MKYLFVGEKKSELAKKMGVSWVDGRLAAKQLFDALIHCGIDPNIQQFCNWFEGGKSKVRSYEGKIVAMGKKVSDALTKEKIPHIAIVHPAARGKIRKKELYFKHIKERLAERIEALDTANENAKKNGLLGVLPQITQPSFQNASKFHAKVRKVLKET